MSFENPINKRVKKYEEQLQNSGIISKDEIKEENKEEQIISLDEILKTSTEEKTQIELIDFPHSAIITGVPKAESLTPEQLGAITIKYDNNFNEIKQAM